MQRDPDSGPDPVVFGPPASHAADATRLRVAHLIANPTRRDQVPASSAPNSQTPLSDEPVPTASAYTAPTSQRQHRQQPFSSSNSQDTSSTNDTDLVFTPSASASDGAMSPVDGSARDSSQDSQLLQLSQVAAAQERIPDASTDAGDSTASSKKRMADGMVKHTRSQSSASPVRMGGHSRNTSAVSIASTNGSRIGDLSVQLATRLSYAMRKVNNGWQGLPIDQVERLASQATSPTSSNSTIHLRNGSSASPQLSNGSQRGSNNPPATGLSQQFHARHGDGVWRDTGRIDSVGSPTSPAKATYSLAPPVSIQPSRHLGNPRRNSNSKLTPTFLSGAHASPNPGPNTPGHPSPYLGTAHQMTPWNDPILFSPRGKREQDAVESLMSMSSPGNSANLKHAFPSSSQPLPSAHTAPQRTALPTAQPRKSLPSGRPIHHGRSQSQTQKRVGFEKTRADMDMDESFGSPYSRGTPRRKVNGSGAYGAGEMYVPAHRPKPIPAPSGIMVPSRPRRARADEDIDRMLERAAAAPEDSDSDGEIQIPVSRARRDGAGAVGA
ncbi:cell cycle transcriptional repressor whi5 [Podospora aff. communis PSN243]|uniref:Cell cycle transcriptional repressor whi5 n=1 Tax=Podospora aff. communis PSN243 TaxID=3040156 RepID=A0AAV9GFN4_9PEZI|nr:cell cycle transcriptional repressor whi5 [Podospora aff. communis PSN243]